MTDTLHPTHRTQPLDPDARARAFFLAVLDHLGVVIGEKSVEALVRYAAAEAAAEAAHGGPAALGPLLAEYGRAMGWEVTVLTATPKEALVSIRWDKPHPGAAAQAVAQGMVHGFYLAATRSRGAESSIETGAEGTSRVRVTRTM